MNAIEKRAMQTAIDLIALSVRTAPKSGGIDDVVCFIASEREKRTIAQAMVTIGQRNARAHNDKVIAEAIRTSWVSDATTVERSGGLILVGVKGKTTLNFNCTMCGFENCAAFRAHDERNKKSSPAIAGPFCILKIWDLGIAISSAAKTASMLNVDNRIMYRIGVAVLQAPRVKKIFLKGQRSDHINPILGLPLSASGKNIYFDRLDKLQAAKVLSSFYQKHS